MIKFIALLKKGIILGFLSSIVSLSAQSQWEQIPNFTGGTVNAFVQCDTAGFIGTSLGVNIMHYNLPDLFWEIFVIPPYPVVTGLALFHDSLIIGTRDGLYISDLKNPSLQDFSKSLPGKEVLQINEFVWNGELIPVVLLQDHGIFWFNAATHQWISWNSGLTDLDIHDLIQGDSVGDATVRESFWVATHDGISTCNGWGNTWEPMNPNPPSNQIQSLLSYYTWEHTLYAGTNNGLYQWKDTSATWSLIQEVPVISIPALYKERHGNGFTLVVAATSESESWVYNELLVPWESFPLDLTAKPSINTLRSSGPLIVALTNHYGIYRASLPNLPWESFNNSLYQLDIRSLIEYEGQENYFLAATHGNGILRVLPDKSVIPFNEGLKSPDADCLYDAGPYLVASAGGHMYYLDESQQSWVDFSYGWWNTEPCLGISYTNTSIAMVVARENGISWNYFMIDTLWHSLNKGIENVTINSLVTYHDTMYVSAWDSGVYWFNTMDSTWHRKTMAGIDNESIRCLEISNGTLYAGTYNGIFVLKPDSTQWVAKNDGLATTNTITLKAYHDLLFASFYPNNFYVANTETMQWRDRSEYLPQYTFIGNIYINDPYVYASSNRSLWKRNLGEMNPGIPELKTKGSIIGYPNPCKDQFFIDTRYLSGTLLSLKLVDIHGKTMLEQIPRNPNAPIQSIDMSLCPSGLYFLSLQTNEGRVVSKIIKN